ncbi:MAG: archaeosortase/exosortase family protein [Deltaproteobacteria bacterium]|nr:archaeosortase/exosortase family protein [Deltaproteobacteria bacterium]
MTDGESQPEGGKGAQPASIPPAAPASGLMHRWRAIWANPAYRFVLLFLPYLVLVSILYPLIVEHYFAIVQAFIKGTAGIEYWIFSWFSDDVRLDDKLVFFNGFAVKIIDECTGIYEMLIFAAAVLAFPATRASKGVGILLGCPLIYLFNVVRIAMLIVVGRYWPVAFDFMHLYFWQGTMIIWIVSIWMLWIVKVVRSDEDAALARV